MVAPAVAAIPYVIAAASAIYGGISGSSAAKRNANNALAVSLYNSRMNLQTGLLNANAITAATMASNAASWAIAQIGAHDTMAIAEYNADLKMLVADYNAQVISQEAYYIWDAANTDVTLIERDLARTKGDILVAYGASGVQINETDSVADAMIAAGTEAELNKFIVRHGADIQALKVRNEAARSRWDGYVAAQQITYEGSMGAQSQLMQAGINIAGNTAQGRINASTTWANAQIGAANVLFGGVTDSASYRAQSSQAMTNGMFQAGAQGAQAYFAYKMPASQSAQGTPATSSNVYPTRSGTEYGSLLTN